MKDVDPYAFRRPADETIVERLARPIDVGRIDPASAALKHMRDPADDPAVVDARLAPRVGRQKRFQPRKLVLGQPEEIVNHQPPPFGSPESQIRNDENLYGSGA